MSNAAVDNDLSGWFSTYGLITAQRILDGYRITLSSDDLSHALKIADTFYHRLLRVPLRNVFNGIILQQAQDYQLYAQKLFIDYLLSGENAKPEESPGANIRDDLEQERLKLVKMSERFRESELLQEALIAKSQATLMQDAGDWNAILQNMAKAIQKDLRINAVIKSDTIIMRALVTLLCRYNFKGQLSDEKKTWAKVDAILGADLSRDSQELFLREMAKLSKFTSETELELADYSQQIKTMGQTLRRFRSDFYDFIIHVNELMALLPEYKIDNQQLHHNRESLYFDSALGDER